MDDGEPDLSNPEVFSTPSAGEDLPSISMDTFFNNSLFDNIVNDGHTCTHTHTCNPPGPNLSHTHTCFHVHTKILSAPSDETAESVEKSASAKKRPCNNREAVRKYREKKKARATSLEEEAAHLRAINQQLSKRLQNQAALEAEIARLKCLLVDLRGRIEGEIGSFPYHKPVKGSGDFVSIVTQGNMLAGAQVLNPCSFHCDDQVNWVYPGMQGKDVGETAVFDDQGLGVCEIGNMQCMGSSTLGSQDFASCKSKTAKPVDCSSNATRLEGL
ncbi:unnamed protein product, partial [Musa textilis]